MKKALSLALMLFCVLAVMAQTYSYTLNANSPVKWPAFSGGVTEITTADGITLTHTATYQWLDEGFSTSHIRFWNGSTLAIAKPGYAVTKVVLTATGNNYAPYFTADGVESTKSSNVQTWVGSTQNFVAAFEGNFRANAIEITLEQATAVSNLNADKAVASVRYYNLAGQEASEAFNGVNIMVVNYQDGTQNVTKVVK